MSLETSGLINAGPDFELDSGQTDSVSGEAGWFYENSFIVWPNKSNQKLEGGFRTKVFGFTSPSPVTDLLLAWRWRGRPGTAE